MRFLQYVLLAFVLASCNTGGSDLGPQFRDCLLEDIPEGIAITCGGVTEVVYDGKDSAPGPSPEVVCEVPKDEDSSSDDFSEEKPDCVEFRKKLHKHGKSVIILICGGGHD